MILNMEIISWFFRFRITGKLTKLRQLQKGLDKHSTNLFSSDKSSKRILNSGERSLLTNRKMLCIMKTADSLEEADQVTVDDNIYKIVKNFSRNFKEFRTNYSKENNDDEMNKKIEVLSKDFEEFRTNNLNRQLKMENTLELIMKRLDQD